MGWWFPTVDPFVLVLATGKTQRVGKMSHYLPWLSRILFVHPQYPVHSLSLLVYNMKGDLGEVLNHFLFNFHRSNVIPPHRCWSEEVTCGWLVKTCIALKYVHLGQFFLEDENRELNWVLYISLRGPPFIPNSLSCSKFSRLNAKAFFLALSGKEMEGTSHASSV